MESITSSTNGQMKYLKELQKKAKTRRESGCFVAEGQKMVQEACTMGLARHLYFAESYFLKDELMKQGHRQNDSPGRIAAITRQVPDWAAGIPYTVVSDKVFQEVADTQTPQGVLAVVRQNTFSWEDILKRNRLKLLLLEDIRDPGNLGTMVRTAEGAGMDAIIASKGTVDLYNPKVVRSTMGSIYRVPFFYVEDFQNTLTELREQSVTVLAAHLDGENGYDEISYPTRCGVLIGNEANGLTNETVSQADCYVKIPMAGQVESLNAAVAAALLMYQMCKELS